jgi:hydrogenase maturation protease
VLTETETHSIPHYPRLLILGIGNLLMGDEGLGVHLAQRLEKRELPPGAAVLDGGTGGFHLMPYFEEYPCLIMIDATLDDRPPGTIRLLQPRFAADFPRAMSTHDIGLRDLVEGLHILGRLPIIHLFVVSIAELQDLYIGLSPAIEAVMPELEQQVLGLAGDLLAKRDGIPSVEGG